MLEIYLLSLARNIYSAGQSSTHLYIGKLRNLHNKSGWKTIPGVNNVFSDHTRSSVTLNKMFLKLNTETTTGHLDVILLTIYFKDVSNGIFEKFINNMKVLSSKGNKPYLFISSCSPISISEQKNAADILTKYKLADQFSAVKFISFGNYLDVNKQFEDRSKSTSKYSVSEGPNILFYDSLTYLSTLNFSTVLLLEPDVKFVKNYWFDELAEICLLETFWIYGSYYKGNQFLHRKFSYHLNGVALYNIGNIHFMDFISILKSYHVQNEKLTGELINFDVTWEFYKDFIYKEYQNDPTVLRKIRIIDSNLMNTNLIINLSCESDISLPIENIIVRYPKASIIHQKFIKRIELLIK